MKRKAALSLDDTIMCFEKWDFDKFEEIRQLTLPNKETASKIKRIDISSLITRDLRVPVRYAVKGGFKEGRVYGFLVKDSSGIGGGGGGGGEEEEDSNLLCTYQKRTPINNKVNTLIEVGEGLQRLPGWIRRFISHEYYYDFDIVNCAPTLLKQILERKNICPPELTDYLVNREKIFEKYTNLMDRKSIKTVFLKVFHMGACDEKIPESHNLREAIRKAMILLSETIEYKALWLECKAKGPGGNTIGTFVAIVWQKEESRVLLKMREFFTLQGYNPAHMVLCFDGLMLEKNSDIQRPIDLLLLEDYITEQLAYRVKIEEKSLEPTVSDYSIYENCRKSLLNNNNNNNNPNMS